MDYLKTNKLRALIFLLLLAGLAVSIYLVQTKQIFKSRATDDAILRGFSIRVEGGTVTPKGDGRSFDTDTLNVNISFGNPGPLPPQEIPSEGGDTGGSIPTVDLCDPYQFENNYDQPAGCDPNSCGYELWSCMHDRNRVWAFENNDQCPCP